MTIGGQSAGRASITYLVFGRRNSWSVGCGYRRRRCFLLVATARVAGNDL